MVNRDRRSEQRADSEDRKAGSGGAGHLEPSTTSEAVSAARALTSADPDQRRRQVDTRSLAALQRSAGNRAVTGHLARRGLIGAAPDRVALQRDLRGRDEVFAESLRRFEAGERAEGPARPMDRAEKARMLAGVVGTGGPAGRAIEQRGGAQRTGPRRPPVNGPQIAERKQARHVRAAGRERSGRLRREQLVATTTRRGRAARMQRSVTPSVKPTTATARSAALERDRIRGRRVKRTG